MKMKKKAAALSIRRLAAHASQAKRREKVRKKVAVSAMLNGQWVEPLDPSRTLPTGYTWYAIATKPRREIVAAHWLESMGGVFTLTPLKTVHRAKGRKGGLSKTATIEAQVPLIAGFVLAGFADPPTWLQIWDSHHIRGAVSLGGHPLTIPFVQIERFRSMSDEDRRKIDISGLQVGSKARFVGNGPFSGHLVEIESMGPKSVTAWQDIFGGRRLITVARELLETV